MVSGFAVEKWWVELFGIYFGVKSGSISAVEVGDGARYWMPFWAA